MKRISCLIAVLFPLIGLGQQVQEKDACLLAEKFMSAKTSGSVRLTSGQVRGNHFENLYFFVDEATNNFVVMSASKNAYPVVAYSTEGTWNADMPDVVQDYFTKADAQVAEAKQMNKVASSDVAAEWKMLEQTGLLPGNEKSSIAPLLSTTWNQDCYYNAACPAHSSGPCGYVYAGCVATAMGQVMKYHEYPPTGIGSNTYYPPSFPMITVDFSTGAYTWDSMPASLSADNSYIAQMLYHCGVSVDMDYGWDGSGAQSADAATALVTNFGYADYAFYIEKSTFSDANWVAVIDNELRSKRPVYYSASGSEGGHAFVADGRDSGSKLHFNWGWGGAYNGYFAVSNLNPGGSAFNDYQAAIMGIEPPVDDMVYCQPATTLTALSDTVTDGSGTHKYGNDSHCTWTIQPPGAGLIYIHFTEMAADQDIDFVYVYNGTSTSDPLVATITGFELPNEILVWGPSAYVVFESDAMLRADGFSFYYVSSAVGLEEAWNNEKITVFPNPADDRMSVEIDPLVLPAVSKIELLSMSGQVLQSIANPIGSQQVDVSSLTPGTYALRFVGENDSYVTFVEIL